MVAADLRHVYPTRHYGAAGMETGMETEAGDGYRRDILLV